MIHIKVSHGIPMDGSPLAIDLIYDPADEAEKCFIGRKNFLIPIKRGGNIHRYKNLPEIFPMFWSSLIKFLHKT